MNIKPLITHLNNYLPLTSLEIEELEDCVTERKIKKRQFLLQEGDICKYYTFVVEGCLKMYKVDDKGQEHNLQFAIENEWIMDIGSFHSEEPSTLNIEAIESATVLQMTKPDLLFFYTEYPKFNRIFRVQIEDAFINMQKRVLQNISSTAEERYLDFQKNSPHLFNRISNVQIASYIGVTPEFLSKVRKNLSRG